MFKVTILIIGIVALYINYQRGRLLSSSTIWLAAYILIFVGHPLLSEEVYTHENEIDIYGLIGIVLFCMGSFIATKIRVKNEIKLLKADQKTPSFDIAFRLYIVFIVAFFATLIIAIGQGGISAILSGSITAKQMVLDETLNISSLYLTFLQLLFPCTLAVWFSQSDDVEKIKSRVCLIGYLILTIIFGFTRLFAICLLGIILFFQLRYKDRTTQLFILVIGLFILSALMVSMNFIRTLGLGRLSSFKDWININYILESTDFSASYYYFDRLLSFPSPHINPIVWFKAFYAFIPRSVWPLKPEPLSLQVLKYTNPSLAATGYSTAGNSVLGEGYAIMGVAGIILFPLIWGYVCTRLDIKYQNRLKSNEESSLADIMYNIFTFLIIISAQRGDWSQYTVIILYYYFIPLILISVLGNSQFSKHRKIYIKLKR